MLVLSTVWYKIFMQRSLVVKIEYLTCHLYFLGIQSRLKARVYTEKIQVSRGIFHGIPQESVA